MEIIYDDYEKITILGHTDVKHCALTSMLVAIMSMLDVACIEIDGVSVMEFTKEQKQLYEISFTCLENIKMDIEKEKRNDQR